MKRRRDLVRDTSITLNGFVCTVLLLTCEKLQLIVKQIPNVLWTVLRSQWGFILDNVGLSVLWVFKRHDDISHFKVSVMFSAVKTRLGEEDEDMLGKVCILQMSNKLCVIRWRRHYQPQMSEGFLQLLYPDLLLRATVRLSIVSYTNLCSGFWTSSHWGSTFHN